MRAVYLGWSSNQSLVKESHLPLTTSQGCTQWDVSCFGFSPATNLTQKIELVSVLGLGAQAFGPTSSHLAWIVDHDADGARLWYSGGPNGTNQASFKVHRLAMDPKTGYRSSCLTSHCCDTTMDADCVVDVPRPTGTIGSAYETMFGVEYFAPGDAAGNCVALPACNSSGMPTPSCTFGTVDDTHAFNFTSVDFLTVPSVARFHVSHSGKPTSRLRYTACIIAKI
jgi:hypothetical protein